MPPRKQLTDIVSLRTEAHSEMIAAIQQLILIRDGWADVPPAGLRVYAIEALYHLAMLQLELRIMDEE